MAHKSKKHKRGLEQQRCCLAANIERRGKAEKTSTSAIPPHKKVWKQINLVDPKEPLIDTWPQGGGGMEPPHLTPDGREALDNLNADCGNRNQRPVTDRRLALHTTSGTTPSNTGAELCAPAPTWEEQQDFLFRVLSKNCRSLKSADRFDELIGDLHGAEWDMVMLSETWRSQLEEYWITEQDHIFAGVGHDSGRRGVGILLHKRWRKHVLGFTPISERLCYIDVKIHGVKYRLVSVYFPDSTYPDTEVQKVYDLLSEVIKDARKNKIRLIVAGDFNARVGQGDDAAEHPSSGGHGYGEQNSRGQWMLTWSAAHDMKIANTFFRKQNHKLITHVGTQGQTSQLDYILVDNWTRAKLQDVESGSWIDLGSDHTCLKAVLNFKKN
jgi:exonuclease III